MDQNLGSIWRHLHGTFLKFPIFSNCVHVFWKGLVVDQNMKNWASGRGCVCRYLVYGERILLLLSAQGHFEVIRCISDNLLWCSPGAFAGRSQADLGDLWLSCGVDLGSFSRTPSHRETALSSGDAVFWDRTLQVHLLRESLQWWVSSPAVQHSRCSLSGGRWDSLVLSISLSLSRSSVSPSLPRLSQLEPHTLTMISPSYPPTVFPNPYRSHIYSVDSFILWFMARQCSHQVCMLTRKHTPSLVSHTPLWLAS